MRFDAIDTGFEVRDGDRVYTLEEKLGEGGQGVCYRADFHGDSKVVKLMRSEEDLIESLRPRLLELNTALGTRYRVFRVENVALGFAVVGDYYSGKNLRDTIDANDKVFTEDETKDFLLQMSRRWLGPLYSRRLIHNDIKPENIIVENGIYSLIDFGGVRSLDSNSLSMSLVNGKVVKSLCYSRFYGSKSLQNDLYSVAKVAKLMLTGEDPNFFGVLDENLDRKLNGEMVDALKVSDKMKNVLRRMLSVNNSYNTPEEIVLDLEERSELVISGRKKLVLSDYSLPNDFNPRVVELRDIFEKNYLAFGPEVRPLSDVFITELEDLVKLVGFAKISWGEDVKDRDYYSALGRVCCRKLVDFIGYENFWYMKKGNFYFGLIKGDSNCYADYYSYVPKRLKARRGTGFRSIYCSGIYSPIKHDDVILKRITTPLV